jgi:pimeloyl-ACP methyl ester carboxylesterase
MESLTFFINRLKRDKPSIFQSVCITLVITCFVAAGCSLVKLKKEVNEALEGTCIVGRINVKHKGTGPVIVAACSMGEEKKIANYTVLHGSGEYEIGLHKGEYYVFAYRDENSNLIYDEGEAAGHYGDLKLVDARKVSVVYDIDIDIPEEGRTIEIPRGFKISSARPKTLHSRQAGAITDLDDERFSRENGVKGFWEPSSFFQEFGGNIVFLEEYDPEKTPVLFIHGAAGTPKSWKYFADNIDRTRFQPWFFYYPTGFRIESMSHLLLWKLVNLQTKYQFNKIYITAHSMGGLLAKSFIVNSGRQFPYVKLFISLATPWGGNSMAEYGVRQSPAVIPSWIDMQPESDFITSLYRVKIPEDVNFYMFSGHRGSRNPFRSNNDGTIELASIQDLRAQSEAKMNFTFSEDHASILNSKDVLEQYNTILNAFDEKQSASLDRSGGHIKVSFSYDFDFDGVRPSPSFILLHADTKEVKTTTYLNGDDSGRILGPFPPGDYIAGMVSAAVKTKQKYASVSVESGKIKELEFFFIPDGVIRGRVTAPVNPKEIVVGMPEDRYRSADSEINIQSITLEGNGIHRALRLTKGDDVKNYHPFIPFILRDDLCYNNLFAFFGLPAGDYKLVIKTEGYKTIVKHYSVMPGTPKDFRNTELTPE